MFNSLTNVNMTFSQIFFNTFSCVDYIHKNFLVVLVQKKRNFLVVPTKFISVKFHSLSNRLNLPLPLIYCYNHNISFHAHISQTSIHSFTKYPKIQFKTKQKKPPKMLFFLWVQKNRFFSKPKK